MSCACSSGANAPIQAPAATNDAADLDGVVFGADRDGGRLGVDVDHASAGADLRAKMAGLRDELMDRAFRAQKTAIRLEQPRPAGGQLKGRKAARHILGLQGVVPDVVQPRRHERARHDGGAGMAHFQDAGRGEQGLAANPLEGAPPVVGAAEQGHVGGVFEIGQANGPALAMRRTAIMAELELLEPDRAGAARGKIVEGGATHGAEADDGGIVGV